MWHCKHYQSHQSFDTSIAVLYTELWCQCLIAHQYSLHLLCLSLHNYTSWSCFLSPPDHLFPAANLLSVPASASTSSPYWVNLSIDNIFSSSPLFSPLSVSVIFLYFKDKYIHAILCVKELSKKGLNTYSVMAHTAFELCHASKSFSILSCNKLY